VISFGKKKRVVREADEARGLVIFFSVNVPRGKRVVGKQKTLGNY
jgi:hypothetical protein